MSLNPLKTVKRERCTPVIYPLQHQFPAFYLLFFFLLLLHCYVCILMCVCVCADDRLVTILRHQNFLKEMQEIAAQGESRITHLVYVCMKIRMMEGSSDSFSFKVVGGELIRLQQQHRPFRLQMMSLVSWTFLYIMWLCFLFFMAYLIGGLNAAAVTVMYSFHYLCFSAKSR